MPDNTEKSITGPEYTTYLPNFCNGDAFLRLLLVIQLFAIVFALVGYDGGRNLFVHIALISVVMLWVGLATAAILCLAAQRSVRIHGSTGQATDDIHRVRCRYGTDPRCDINRF